MKAKRKCVKTEEPAGKCTWMCLLLMINKVAVRKDVSLLLEFLYLGCFFKGSSTVVPFCWRNSVIWDMRVYLCCCSGSVSEWLPWALSRTRHRVSCSKLFWRNSNTLLFSPWPVLQNIVCTSVILPTPWAHRETLPSLSLATITTVVLALLLSARMSILFLSFSLSRSHYHVILFLLHKDIVKQIHPHTFSH